MMKPQRFSLCAAGVNIEKFHLLDEYLVNGATLDVGCGNGLYGLHILSRGCPILQVDIMNRRESSAQELPFRLMDAQHLDLPDASYDNVVAFDVMEHLDDDVLFLQNVRRICRKRLLLSVPNADDEQPGKIALTHMHYKDKTHRREYTKDALLEVLRRANFKPIIIKPHFNKSMPHFAHALASEGIIPKVVAQFISFQCDLFEWFGWFENRCVADWFCVAE
ncbi:MAG: class I SAM-dependent methyltransferase [Myxococcales bacterium]|nr:MAG: class I SAM-dependent methyltransferase [Myxococcales bacterium]